MRTATLRLYAGSLAVATLAALVVLTPAHGQQAVPVPAQEGAEEEPKDKAAPLEVMIFPADRDAKNMIKAVNDYLEEFKKNKDKAPWDKICFAAQQVLDAKSDSFYEAKSDEGQIQRISAKAEANRLIGRFPTEGKQFYQLTFGGIADGLLNDAINKNYDRTLLAELSQRYFHTKAGAQAALLLAGLHLDRGNYVEAAYSFERLLERNDADEFLTPLNTFKAVVALQRAGQSSDTVKKLMDQLEKKFPRDGLKIGLRSYGLEELKEELAKTPESLFGKVGDAYVTTRLGNISHTAVSEGGAPFLDPAFTKDMVSRTEDDLQEGVNWVRQNLSEVLKSLKPVKGDVAISSFFPLSTQNLVFLRTYDGIFAYVTKDGFSNHGKPAKAGDLYWYADAKGSLATIMAADNNSDVKNRFQQYRDQHKLKTILFENALIGSMTHDGQNLYAVDDTALPPPPTFNDPNNMGIGFPGGANPTAQIGVDKLFTEGNRLVAINMLTGTLSWQLGNATNAPALTEEQEDKTDNPLLLMSDCFFVGPPLPVNGKLYVLFEKNGRMRLACLDPLKVRHFPLPNGKPSDKAPEIVWTQRLGEPNTKLPLDAIRRFQCSHLTYSEGVMICPTNAGAVVAIDVMSRSLLWARSYRSLKVENTNELPNGRRGRIIRGGAQMGAGSGMSVLSSDRYRNAAPIISNGRVVFSAYDSDSVDCLDLRTGDLLWTESRRPGDLYVAGVIADKVVIVGKDSVRAINLIGRPRERTTPTGREDAVIAWRDLRIGNPAGHGVVSKGGIYYLPLSNSPDGNRPEIWAIDVAKGTVNAKSVYRKKTGPDDLPMMLGNLAFHEGQLVSQSPVELAVFPLTDLKKKEMDQLLKANPNDPVGLVARGEINMDNGKVLAAIADFKEAARHNPPEESDRRLREKLYSAYTELLRKDFNGGEQYLDEYKTLTNVKVDAEDPKLKQQQIDEGFRRKTIYLKLMATGRRNQGRLAEAFDYYRQFGQLGDNKQLVTIDDEAYGQTRPDVWARGQISTMIQEATDPAVRKPLEDRVSQEWQTVRASQDPKKLEEFVQSFGDYFAVGREAQLLLAEKKMSLNSEEDSREAQALLMKVAATAPEKTIAGQAVETLARLMTRRGMMDNAVSLYSRLGEDYGNVPIREGKTGADFFNDLLTDKRLLPYLEPTRVPTPDRIQVKAVRGSGGGQYNIITVQPEGSENNPFYERNRLQLQPNNTGDGTWILKVLDRSTGQEKASFPRMKFYTPAGIPHHRIAQARGQLLLVHTGYTIHCLDLVEQKELWSYNPLGDTKLPNNQNYGWDGTVVEEDNVFLPLGQDGTRLGIGRATIFESNVACVLEKDGLVGLDPFTGNKLWTRNNVSPSSLLFGDARHVFVVEKTTDGRFGRARVFRTADGRPVDSAPDCSSLMSGNGFLGFVGRNLLVTSVKEKVRTLRLYDTLTGQDIWAKDYPDQAEVCQSYTSELTAVIKPDGRFQVLSVKTGQQLFAGQIDPANVATHVKNLEKPVLLADAERFYLVLNQANNAGQNRYYGGSLKFTEVRGAIYCFDRSSGKRLWYTDKLLEKQQLLIDRFDEVPALVAGTQMQSDDGTNQYVYRVAIIDKMNGRLRYLEDHSQNGYFYSLTTDPKNGTARVMRGDMYWDISPATKSDSAERTTRNSSSPASGPVQAVVPIAVPAQRLVPVAPKK